MPFADHARQCAPALRGSRQRHAASVRARVRRRPSRLGAADALLLAALSLHHLFGARLYAFRRAADARLLRLREIPRRRDRDARSSQDRQGAHLRPVDGRLRDALRRHQVSAARALAYARRHRLGLGARLPGGIPRRRGSHREGIRQARLGGGREDLRHGPGAHSVRGEGPARLQGVLRPVREPRRQGRRQHAARLPDQAAVGLRLRGRGEEDHACRR